MKWYLEKHITFLFTHLFWMLSNATYFNPIWIYLFFHVVCSSFFFLFFLLTETKIIRKIISKKIKFENHIGRDNSTRKTTHAHCKLKKLEPIILRKVNQIFNSARLKFFHPVLVLSVDYCGWFIFHFDSSWLIP